MVVFWAFGCIWFDCNADDIESLRDSFEIASMRHLLCDDRRSVLPELRLCLSLYRLRRLRRITADG